LRPCGSYLRLKIAPSNIGQRQVFSPSGQDCCNHSFSNKYRHPQNNSLPMIDICSNNLSFLQKREIWELIDYESEQESWEPLKCGSKIRPHSRFVCM
jgi:hypothetical protein